MGVGSPEKAVNNDTAADFAAFQGRFVVRPINTMRAAPVSEPDSAPKATESAE
jgi:hypothetical protein